jgi:prokaryotic ubiquitin-like protein Pup
MNLSDQNDQPPQSANDAAPSPDDLDLDATLDEIDEVLEENAEEFVKQYVRKGGQGDTALFTMEFLIGAVAGGVAGNATYDMIKAALFRTFRAFRQIGRPVSDVTDEDGSYLYEEDERELAAIYEMARRIPTPYPPRHDPDEALAVHWLVYLRELHREAGFVQLLPKHYRKIAAAGMAAPERLQPSQLVAKIVDQWLRENPNADIGVYDF